MDLDRIDQIAWEQMAQRRPDPDREPGFILHHGRRSARLALHLAEQMGFDVPRDVVYTAGLFHDVGKGLDPHNESGARLAGELLSGACPPDELAQVCAIIRLHNQRHKPNDYAAEVHLVQDADFLDHVGALEVWINLYGHGVRLETLDAALERFHSEERRRALAFIRDSLNYDLSARLFDQRVEWVEGVYLELERVQGGGDAV